MTYWWGLIGSAKFKKMLCSLTLLFATAFLPWTEVTAVDATSYPARELWAVKLIATGDHGDLAVELMADRLSSDLGLANAGRVEPFERLFLFQLDAGEVKGRLKRAEEVDAILSSHPHVLWSSWQRPLKRVKRGLVFEDKYFSQQWHLLNSREVGHDINVTWPWSNNITGRGVVIAVVDDGLEHSNPDLHDNYNAAGSYDFNDEDPDPFPSLSGKTDNAHGTKCGGLIAAVANEVCGVGVAYGAQVAGIRILDGAVTDLLEGKSFVYKSHINWIYSCSWGPDDSGKIIEGPGPIAQEAFTLGTSKGRFGYGSIYVFASGNGGATHDNCNFDGYANSIYTLTVGAVEEHNLMPYYAEPCSAILAVTYSNGHSNGDRSIVTTDSIQNGGCTQAFSGTSAAAPIAAGIVALILQVRPCLTWRDVQTLLVYTAVKVDVSDARWVWNGAGFHHSNQHGFGLMDSFRLTTVSAVWPLLPNMTQWSSAHKQTKPLPPTGQLTDTIDVRSDGDLPATLEYVAVTMTLHYPCRGALEISLTSPHGTSSVLATSRIIDDSSEKLSDWTFTSVTFWGEEPQGVWSLTVTTDINMIASCVGRRYYDNTVVWKLVLYGSSLTARDVADRQRVVNAIVSGSCDPGNGSCDWPPATCPPLPSDAEELHVTVPFFFKLWEMVLLVVAQGVVAYAVFYCGIEACQRLCKKHRAGVKSGRTLLSVFSRSAGDQVAHNDQETALLLQAEDQTNSTENISESPNQIETTFTLSPDQSNCSDTAATMATTEQDPVVEIKSDKTTQLVAKSQLETVLPATDTQVLIDIQGEVGLSDDYAPVVVVANELLA